MPEDTRNREVVGGSLWTGEVFGFFCLKGGGMEKEIRTLNLMAFPAYIRELLNKHGADCRPLEWETCRPGPDDPVNAAIQCNTEGGKFFIYIFEGI